MASPCNSLNVQTIKISTLASPTRALKGGDIFLLIQNDGTLYSRKSNLNSLVTFLKSVPSGSYSGSFSGSARGHFTGSFTGSFKGYMSASAAFTKKAAFHGTASWAMDSVHALTADSVPGALTGTGVANDFTYWTGASSTANVPFVQVDTTTINKGTGWPNLGGSLGSTKGRTILSRPLAVNNYTGQHLIQYSASQYGKNYLYDIGLQCGNNYIRTGANFAIYYSGSFTDDTCLVPPYEKDVAWKPDATNSGKSGWTVLGVRTRLLGIGHFPQSNYIQAQCHVHLSSSYGWPGYYATNASPYNVYKPNENVFLVTSGSAYTKLLRVSGSGQLDVAGDIVSFSTFASSDERLKDNIQPIEDAYSKIDALNPVSFEWNGNGTSDFGLIAQEVEQIYPDFVKDDMNGYKHVKYNSFIPLLIKTVQEQQQQIAALAEKIAQLESK